MSKVLSHDARLRKSTGEGTRQVADRILRVFGEASAAEIEQGALWYPDAYKIARSLATQSGHSVERVAAVIAHLSTRCAWGPNVAAATSVVLTGECPDFIMGRSRERAFDAMEAADPWATFGDESRNLKTRRFMKNILGDREVVTIDTWALRVAHGFRTDFDNLLRHKGFYQATEYAYQVAANRIGVCPVTVQATTWGVIRGHKFD